MFCARPRLQCALRKADGDVCDRSGDDERGYEDLSAADYEATIAGWADNQLADEARAEAETQAATDKAALLAKLGITADEAKLLLS